MKIEHAALWVRDIEKEKDFFVKYFGGMSNTMYNNENTGFKSYFLKFDEGARLEIMSMPGLTDKGDMDMVYGIAHIAFSVGAKENVLELTEKLRNDGYRVVSEPRTTGDGYFESCVLDLEGNRIEITV